MLTRLLLIEDNPGDALIFREKLDATDLDYELVHTPRLAEGIELLGDQPFDLVLCDLSLPDAQGLEAVLRVREAAPARPLIVLTGLDDAQTAARAREAGAADYLVKWYMDAPSLARYIRYAIAHTEPPRPRRPAPPTPAPEGPPETGPPEAGLRPRPEALAEALEALEEGIAVVDDRGGLLYANRQARTWIGQTERFPWPTSTGRHRVETDGRALTLSSAATTWNGRPATLATLRPEPPVPAAPPALVLDAAEAALAFAEHTARQTHWMTDVLRGALDVHRQAAANHLTPRPEAIDLADIAQRVARELREEALRRGLPLRVTARRKKVVAFADRALTTRAVRRLLLDALHRADMAGSIEATVDVLGPRSTLEVTWHETTAPGERETPVAELAATVAETLARTLGGRLAWHTESGRCAVTLTLPGREDTGA